MQMIELYPTEFQIQYVWGPHWRCLFAIGFHAIEFRICGCMCCSFHCPAIPSGWLEDSLPRIPLKSRIPMIQAGTTGGGMRPREEGVWQ